MTQPYQPAPPPPDITSAAGPPPGPATDPYGPIEAQAPGGVGPIIANALRILDAESKAGPNRVIGSLLASPVGGVLTHGSGAGTSARIMRNAQAGAIGPPTPLPGSSGAQTGALSDFYENTPLGMLPFFRTTAQTLADPLLGVGPIAAGGAPLRAGVEGLLRGGAFGLGGAARGLGALRGVDAAPDFASVLSKGSTHAGLQTLETAAGPQSMFKVAPGASWQAQAVANVGDFINQAGLGLPGNTAQYFLKLSGSMFKPATMQKIRETESSYRDLLDTIQGRSGMPIIDWWHSVKTFDPKQFEAQFNAMAISPQQRQLFLDDLPEIKRGIGSAESAQNTVYTLGYDLIKRQGGDLPALAQERKDGWARVKTGLQEQGIDSTDKLYQAYLGQYGDTAKVEGIKMKMEGFDADPLRPDSQLNNVLAGTLSNMRSGLKQVPELPGFLQEPGKLIQGANDVQKGQAVASGVYLANNVFQRVFAQTMNGRSPIDSLMNQVQGLAKGGQLAFGKLDHLSDEQKRLALFPKDIIDWTEHMGLTYPAIMEPGNMSNVMGLAPAADELTKVPPMAIEKMGALYPLLAGGLGGTAGFFSAGLPGALIGFAEGAGAGKFAQLVTPKIKTIERVTETFGRSFIWKNEAARYANEAMTSGVKGDLPFMVQVLQAVEDALKTPYAALENPGMAGQGITVEPRMGGLRDAFQQVFQGARDTGTRGNDALHAFLGEHPDLTSASGTPYSLQPPTGAVNLTPQPVPAIVHRMPSPEDSQALHQFLETSAGQVSAQDLQRILTDKVPGIGKGRINDLAKTWSGVLQDASAAGTAKAQHEMIIPRTTNADEIAKYVFLFHYWASRAVPWWAEQMMSSPQYTAILMRTMADSAKEIAYRGLPNNLTGSTPLVYPNTFLLGGLVHAMYGPGTLYWNLDNPFGGAPSEIAETKLGAGESYNAAADVLKVGASMGLKPNMTADWILHIMGLYGPEAPSPDFFRYGPLFANLPGIWGQDMNRPGRDALNLLRRALSPGGANPGDEHDFLVRTRIRELAQNQGLNPHSPQVELASADPNSDLYRQAEEEVKHEGLAQAINSLMVGPGSGQFMRTQTLENRKGEETIKSQQGLRSDLGSMFEAPLAAREPLMNVYRGLSYSRPTVPELQNLVGNSFAPTQQDPRTISNNYLTWAQSHGIPMAQAWDRANILRYSQETELNRRIADILKSGGQIPLGLPTGPGR